MKLLLDTHTLIWWLTNHPTLSQAAKKAISNQDNLVFISAASAWEIAIKKSLGKLTAPDDLEVQIESNNFQPLPITITHGLAIEELPNHHNDPFDRIIIVQAICESMTVVTRDKKFNLYNISIIKS
ncbi:PilT protein domain protein [Stanieria cyanosphaera PCC 7437]|uniref:PilT protein domain protein n=1 Tax=Stanieria cyanosphaera (strain ATCC 29371 / PCC 7437) TaxID=111780 RepID=K9XZN4_STAC7|nr:type II toxin-antitoxin system VapC family toxin [Stanieria cyanosphaera]AFZ37509.1 PilT protein domain protein [Stanieria cyanosphaera PCC 7437]